ncbi:PdxJ [Desulforapulum autotrophicum HRM2]|uniref:Pyridoxine 5'-phosphate synthase n=1 Tax=Desulforapulum autotrophicum (strain ATCC 43914 / DSM 3382 / VKM B-1955 / HRM2) TaxID=177437 RepID=PDXJ_DESAH|nr:pyridoxine 5'-phosphate synthase [Desulforapulum autotrophicum]C0Q9S7.1 RecName: Full=Pyridoxine 5'-phosphate synthase; Short=PNP synthase [Desulforapulum autotrophicum HRM2]ACN16645.1 PdxJ [Desulforapulum autotrophicum HRM2]
MAKLAVNVDHVATLRQARGAAYPEPAAAALAAEAAGADAIVVHLREDRRHINERDVRVIKEVIRTRLILEMAATPKMLGIALSLKPHTVTLVPEKREEITTEGGLDLINHHSSIKQTVEALKNAGIMVSIFIDPDLDQIKMAHRIDADMIEIHTGAFCDAVNEHQRQREFTRIVDAAKIGTRLKLSVNAGHGICYNTIKAFQGLDEIDEFSIGHSIVARAVLTGMDRAVRDMLALIRAL